MQATVTVYGDDAAKAKKSTDVHDAAKQFGCQSTAQDDGTIIVTGEDSAVRAFKEAVHGNDGIPDIQVQ
jgi:hypothetical protein